MLRLLIFFMDWVLYFNFITHEFVLISLRSLALLIGTPWTLLLLIKEFLLLLEVCLILVEIVAVVVFGTHLNLVYVEHFLWFGDLRQIVALFQLRNWRTLLRFYWRILNIESHAPVLFLFQLDNRRIRLDFSWILLGLIVTVISVDGSDNSPRKGTSYFVHLFIDAFRLFIILPSDRIFFLFLKDCQSLHPALQFIDLLFQFWCFFKVIDLYGLAFHVLQLPQLVQGLLIKQGSRGQDSLLFHVFQGFGMVPFAVNGNGDQGHLIENIDGVNVIGMKGKLEIFYQFLV